MVSLEVGLTNLTRFIFCLFTCFAPLLSEHVYCTLQRYIYDNLSCTVIEVFAFSFNYIVALFHCNVRT